MITEIRNRLSELALSFPGTKTSYPREPKSLPESGLPCAVVSMGNSSLNLLGELVVVKRNFPISWYCHKITLDSLPYDTEKIETLLDGAYLFFYSRQQLGIETNIPFVQSINVSDAGTIQKISFQKENYLAFTINFSVSYVQKFTFSKNQ